MTIMLLFENFNEIHKICQKYGITNYTINPDGTIDVDGNVYLYRRELKKLPLKFRNVSGHFECGNNNLTTLEGAPKLVGGYFDCSHNDLTTLEGAPQSVDAHFYCRNNKLITLEGSPQSVDGDFWCGHNQLTTLVGAPQSVSGSFYCNDNNLTTLEGAPKSVSGDFYCSRNSFDVIRKRFPNDKEFFNANKEWEFFAGDNKISRLRFKEALLDYNRKLPRSIKGYEYI